MLQPYRTLAAVPHAPLLMACSLIASLYGPAVPLVMTFLLVDWTGSYAVGGMLAAALLVGQAVASPVRGRMADRSSAARILLVTGASFLAGMVAMTVLTGLLPARAWWMVVPVALLTGLCRPPVQQIARAIWPRIAGAEGRGAAFAVEATAQELLFVFAPVLAAFAVGFWGSEVAAVLCGSVAFGGAAVFATALWRAGLAGAPPATREGSSAPAGGSLFAVSGFPRLLVFGGLLVAGLVTTDLVLIGWARNLGSPELAGVLAAVWAIGSLVGGLVVGGVGGRPRLARRACFASIGLLALTPVLPPAADPGSPVLVCAILFAGGVAIAPTLAAANGRMAEIAPEHRRSEAFGWFGSACMAGATAASPIAGALLDTVGAGAAAGAAAVVVALGAVLVAHHTVRFSPSVAAREDTRVP